MHLLVDENMTIILFIQRIRLSFENNVIYCHNKKFMLINLIFKDTRGCPLRLLKNKCLICCFAYLINQSSSIPAKSCPLRSYYPLTLLPEISQGAGNGSIIFLLLTRETPIWMASVRSKPYSLNKAGRDVSISKSNV